MDAAWGRHGWARRLAYTAPGLLFAVLLALAWTARGAAPVPGPDPARAPLVRVVDGVHHVVSPASATG